MIETFVSVIIQGYVVSITTPLLFFMPMLFVLSAFKKLSRYDS